MDFFKDNVYSLYHSILICLPEDLQRQIDSLKELLLNKEEIIQTDDDVYHCTILAQVIEPKISSIGDIIQFNYKKNNITYDFNEIDIFPSTENGTEADVLYLKVNSQDLHQLHHHFISRLDNEYGFATFKPHITIAYVEPGSHRNLIGKNFFGSNKILTTNEIYIADSLWNKKKIIF